MIEKNIVHIYTKNLLLSDIKDTKKIMLNYLMF